ncbi:MAG: type II toxin-antitoxin system VapB family antitoxin [Nitrospirota bacterium]
MAKISIDLDDRLVAAGMKSTGCKTRKELVRLAIEELVARKERKRILRLEGKITWAGSLDQTKADRT